MSRIQFSLIAIAAALALPTAVSAGDVTYELATQGVSCAGSAAQAEMAVRDAGDVQSVEADPVTHSVTATFDEDDVTLAAIVESLEGNGFSVGEPVKVQ